MRNHKNTVAKRYAVQVMRVIPWALLIMLTAACNGERRAAEVERLRQERQELLSRIDALQEEQRFLLFERDIHATDKRYLVLDTRKGAGSLRLGGTVLRDFKLVLDGCMRPDGAPSEVAASYVLPKGIIQVIAKKKDPVWYKPDWLYEKEGKEPLRVNAADRLIKGPMGEYALFFGGGFVVHGRPVKDSPPAPMQHACIILEDEDLRVVYNLLDKGSVAYVR